MIKSLFIIMLSNTAVFTINKIECGYKQCPPTRDGALNIHIIPHSHMDAGWVKTFDEYYYGTKTTISTANVQLIYHSVLSELLHDNRRKFTFSETAYFWRWWKEQRSTTRSAFRTLVQEGRIQFAGGGWVQGDEATSDYLQIIDQFTWGLRKLNDTLGPCGTPKAGWQIDTYGHSREHTSLLAQMGYDGLFIGRVDHKQREAMIEEDRMEFMSRGSDVLGKMSDIMTHTLYNLYNPPDGFCFDFLCSDEPIVDDPDSSVYNADKRAIEFISQIERQAKYYEHDNVMVTMGGDFTYQSAANWFMNIDKLINYINSHPANISDVNIFYSTPSCYLKAIYLYGKRDKAVFTEKEDLLPYGSDASTYWTGFYTSRPSIKYLARRAHVFLQIFKQLAVISRMGDSYELHSLRHVVSLVLHHDGITGTSQQHVINDFIKILTEGIESAAKKVSQYLSILTPSWGGSRRPKNVQQFVMCHQLNMSQCRFIETQETILLLVYNPLSVKSYFHVRLPAIALHYSIRDYNDEEVEHQLVTLPSSVINLPGRNSLAIQELVFEAENIPPLGYTSYYISTIRDPLEENAFIKQQKTNPDTNQELVSLITNEYLKVTVDKSTGLLESIQHVDGVKVMVLQNFYFYSQTQQTMHSGSYSFRPDRDRPTPITEKASYHTIRGTLVKEIRQRFSDWVTQTIRLYRGEEFLEMEWIIGPVPVGTDLGKEVVSVFKTNITNNGIFYTDSNSRQMMKRSCWNNTNNQPKKKSVSACYYPVTSRVCINSMNSSVEMCVLTDRAQGTTSYNDGEIELMVHRRLLTDDGFGLEESLNEEEHGMGLVVRGKHRIFLGNFKQEVDDQSFSERASQAARRWLMEPWMFLAQGDKISRRKWQNIRNKRYSALRLHGLPRHIHILTLEPWKVGSVLLRLENTLEKPRGIIKDQEEYAIKSHITVDLRTIFVQHKILTVRETTLAANQWLEEARQMDWSARYVYNGGDDGVLPEDNVDYTDDMKHKESDLKDFTPFSAEETEYIRKRAPPQRGIVKSKSKIRSHPHNYERRRRVANITDNLIETITDAFIEDSETEAATEKESEIAAIENKYINAIKTKVGERKYELNINYNSTKIKSNKRINPRISKSDRRQSNKKKYARADASRIVKRNREIDIEGADDEVTKSIYDMYYKAKPKRTAFKPILRRRDIFKEIPNHNRRKIEEESEEHSHKESDEYKTLRTSKRRVKLPFLLAEGRLSKERSQIDIRENARNRNLRMNRANLQKRRAISRTNLRRVHREETDFKSSEEQTRNEDGDDRYEIESDERLDSRRKKRTVRRDEDKTSSFEDHEQYTITLRPTQIRTFVVWFESKTNLN